MNNLLLKLNYHFTDEDKEKCKPTIIKIIELATIVRRQGILALEDKVSQEESVFLKAGLGMMVDGWQEEEIRKILEYLILADNYSGFELLSRIIMMEGLMEILRGNNPISIRNILLSILGEQYVGKDLDYFKPESK